MQNIKLYLITIKMLLIDHPLSIKISASFLSLPHTKVVLDLPVHAAAQTSIRLLTAYNVQHVPTYTTGNLLIQLSVGFWIKGGDRSPRVHLHNIGDYANSAVTDRNPQPLRHEEMIL